MDSGASGHRKIELQSSEDFTYLVNNAKRAAADSISAAFPPVAGVEDQEDRLRVDIEALVNDFIARTYALAAPNLSINGLPVPDSLLPKPSVPPQEKKKRKRGRQEEEEEEDEEKDEVVYEPFNARLRDRIPDMLREEEDLLREIAALKRRVPAAAAARVADAVRAGIRADEAALEAARDRVAGRGALERALKSGRRMLDLGAEDADAVPGLLQRPEEVKEAFESAVEGLSRVKREMPSTVARMERARAAGSYVIAGR